MPEGRMIADARAAETAPIAPQQIGRHATLIEKHVVPHVPQRLPGAPLAARGDDVRPTLFVGVDRFF
jgi:hypothetical protein